MLTRRTLLKAASALPLCGQASRPPNVILILTDDQGYADLSIQGAEGFRTPHIDRMAEEGVRFTQFYSAAAICSPSRAALMTGCYPARTGIVAVLQQESKIGISDQEKLLPQMLRERGYRTALYGKWHLGRQREFLPLQHGFDEFLGTPGSNDMGSQMDLEKRRAGKAGVEFMQGDKIVEIDPDQSQLTARYTELAIGFIRQNKQRPFFIYLAHNMPHTPLFASEKFRGKSKRGIYGDAMEELDWSVGRILATLKDEGLDRDTLVIFTSDNGPWLIFGDHGGSARPLRGGKRESFEGGFRVPAIFRWPGRIPAKRVSHELVTSMDIVPTVAKLAGAALPKHSVDGRDILPLLESRPGAKSPHEAFYYYYERELRAVRSGPWKLVLPHTDKHNPDPAQPGHDGVRGGVRTVTYPLALYDLTKDPGETKDLAAQFPTEVKRLQTIAQQARTELGDAITGEKGRGVRAPGRVQP